MTVWHSPEESGDAKRYKPLVRIDWHKEAFDVNDVNEEGSESSHVVRCIMLNNEDGKDDNTGDSFQVERGV